MKTIIELEQVTFNYPGGPRVLDEVNLKLAQGDFFALTGPNGSAKTTLLKIILGFLKPQSGKVKLFDQDLHLFNEWFKIGYVPQKTNFFNSGFPASVEEIIWLNKYKSGFSGSRANISAEIDRVLDLVDLADKRRKKIGELSGGELQRTLVARALINQPEVLILDEPTANMDKSAQKKLSELLAKLNRDFGLSILLVSHDEKVIGNAKRVLGIEDGKLQLVR
mgnify:CR=1 FL=1